MAAVIRHAGGNEDSIARVFQALRIAVNNEFGALDAFLRNLPLCLKAGGRVAIIAFHSGEDRRVKKAFQLGERVLIRCVQIRIVSDNINESTAARDRTTSDFAGRPLCRTRLNRLLNRYW